MSDDGELRGVGGWLVVFIVILTIISPGYGIYQVYSSLYEGPMGAAGDMPIVQTLRTFEWSLVGATTLLCWFIAYRLYAVHNWTSVKIAIGGIWIASLGGAIAEYAGISSITGVGVGDIIAETGPRGILQPFVFGLIWTSYLLKSQRVENTYRGGEEQADVFE